MKTKAIIFVILCAIITLSFSFVSVKSKAVAQKETASFKNEPVGGFTSEDQL